MPFVAAAGTVASKVDKVCCSLPGRRGVVMVRQTERDVPLSQHFQDPRCVPALIAEFEAVSPSVRQHFAKFAKPIGVCREVRRKLKKDWTNLASKQGQSVFQQFEAIGRIFGQALPMGNELRRLPGKDEVLSGLIPPAFDGLWRRFL